MTNKTILVTGGAGYIGSHTVKYLLKNKYNVVVLDNLVTGHKEAILTDKFELVDLNDKHEIDKVFKKYKIDGVIHFASSICLNESVKNPSEYYRNNVVNTLNLLDSMKENAVNNIVFSSSCAVYGNPQYLPLDENHPKNPISPYGKTKLMSEEILKDYEKAYGIKHIVLRYFNASGADIDGMIGEAHNPETHLIPLVLRVLKNKEDSITVFGNDYNTSDGTCIRDYVHVEDLARAHMLALEKLFCDNKSESFNLGTSKGVSVMEVIKASEKITGKKAKVIFDKRREGDAAELYADNKKAKSILKWNPEYTDIDTIAKTAWNWELNRKF